MKLILCALAFVPALSVAASGVYKWTDDDGNIHYTQIPPTDRQAESIVQPAPPPSAREAEPAAKEAASVETKPMSEEEKKAKIKEQNCAAARRNLEIYSEHNQIQEAEGKVITLSDEMREVRIKEAHENIRKYCQ